MLFREIPDIPLLQSLLKQREPHLVYLALIPLLLCELCFSLIFPSLIMWKLVSNPSAPIPLWAN